MITTMEHDSAVRRRETLARAPQGGTWRTLCLVKQGGDERTDTV